MFVVALVSCQSHHMVVLMLLYNRIGHQVRLRNRAHGQLEAVGTIQLLHLILQIG